MAELYDYGRFEDIEPVYVYGEDEPFDPKTQVYMSDSKRINIVDIQRYHDQLDREDASNEVSRSKALEAAVLGGAATMALGAIAIAINHSRKKR